MKKTCATLATALALLASSMSTNAIAQDKQQYFPLLTFRTGPYAPSGSPWANGFVDYFKLVNLKGGINGVRVAWEECETGYATDRGVECYERMKGKNGGATVFQTMSTGITLALTERGMADGIPILTPAYGSARAPTARSSSGASRLAAATGPLPTRRSSTSRRRWVVSTSSRARRSPCCTTTRPMARSRSRGDRARQEARLRTDRDSGDAPGVDQKAAWLQIRRARPTSCCSGAGA